MVLSYCSKARVTSSVPIVDIAEGPVMAAQILWD